MKTERAIRLASPPEGKDFPADLDMSRICYWHHRGQWWLYLPRGGVGNLAGHDVTEHEDGTITVSPSILVTAPRRPVRRHGFLRRGVWEACADDSDGGAT